jgi:hypothetical protein
MHSFISQFYRVALVFDSYIVLWYANYVAFAASVSHLKTHIHNSATTKRIYTQTGRTQTPSCPERKGSWYCNLPGLLVLWTCWWARHRPWSGRGSCSWTQVRTTPPGAAWRAPPVIASCFSRRIKHGGWSNASNTWRARGKGRGGSEGGPACSERRDGDAGGHVEVLEFAPAPVLEDDAGPYS